MGTYNKGVEEAKILWTYMDSPEFNINIREDENKSIKEHAIEELYDAGDLSLSGYTNDCPLCEEFCAEYPSESYCGCCPWPGKNGDDMRCCRSESPYATFEAAENELEQAIEDGEDTEYMEYELRRLIAEVNKVVQLM